MDYLKICRLFALKKIVRNAFSFQSIRKMRTGVFFSDLIEYKLGLRVQFYIKSMLTLSIEEVRRRLPVLEDEIRIDDDGEKDEQVEPDPLGPVQHPLD